MSFTVAGWLVRSIFDGCDGDSQKNGLGICHVALYDDQSYIAPFLRPHDPYVRLTLDITWDEDSQVKSSELLVSCIIVSFHPFSILTLDCKGITSSCKCKRFYSPHLDMQRYCQLCSTWYDEQCMIRRSHNPGFDYILGNPPTLAQLTSLPIVRGHHAFGDGNVKKWGIVGTGRRIIAARLKFGDPKRNQADDQIWMEEKIGREFLHVMFGQAWVWYKCPRCSIPI